MKYTIEGLHTLHDGHCFKVLYAGWENDDEFTPLQCNDSWLLIF